MIRKVALLVTTSITLCACATVHAKGPLPEELVGVGETNGYGYVVAYDGRETATVPAYWNHLSTYAAWRRWPLRIFDTFVADADWKQDRSPEQCPAA